ncbi:arsenate reductase (glutaredoxin) [Marinilabiliaceae bacterium JC017]|nr:arsenate reductase (glutaredoxin) [Marinilabiliaceae bacterium JC017]
MIKILHNPRCSKSRAGLKLLEEKGIQPEIVKYLDQPLSTQELKEILAMMGKRPTDILRTNEDLYKKAYKGKELTDDEWIEVMVANPRLIERPIVINGNKAVLGRPAENIETIL